MIDFIIGPNDIADLPKILQKFLDEKKGVCQVTPNLIVEPNFSLAKRSQKVKAYVSIIRGCNKFCTYCIVPETRGREVSREPQSIIEECKKLIIEGYQEITLLGQNVNSYGKDHPEWGCSFANLLERLDEIEGLKRLRFLTSHPVDITKEVIKSFKTLPSLCEFLHFPMQSGSNKILKKMNRHYTKEEYLEKIDQLLAVQPKMCFGTDIIVGFPGESDQDFQETYDLFASIGFSTAFIFAYSPRERTAAAKMADDVPKKVKEERLQAMLQLYHKVLQERLRSLIGCKEKVLVENFKENNLLKGRTRTSHKVLFEGPPSLVGSLAEVNIESFQHETLIGKAEI